MTGSWTIDGFIIGSVAVMAITIGVWLYREVFKKNRGDSK